MKMLIVGQGLAGTLLGFRLAEAGYDVNFMDAPGQTASSSIAAGIINPITGRRFVKSWKIDELLPETINLYGRISNLLGRTYWHPQPLIRTLYNRGDVNDWEVRSADEGYVAYMDDDPALGQLPEITAPVFAYCGVQQAGRVDVKNLVNDYRAYLLRDRRFTAGTFEYDQVPAHLERYDRIIFCEGWRARYNPYFIFAGHSGNKGEVLFVKTDAPQLDRMFKHRVFLVPVEEELYWVGATSENQFEDDAPTAANRKFLEDRLSEVLTVPYEIISHAAAVRPTSRDRRMMIGAHPAKKRLLILNGLGTKGASLAPLGSKWLFEFITNNQAIPAEVDVNRFWDSSK
ncbi:FAD-binding oxidoreductase [Lewinella sp. 4G2]|uniref:NAD(P)/FAD-dependent oxidoreductase n=1 Tax=Lewinella sp. 4G2 TaxID=1803372 RepID=UPI0007B4D123|nr:FAD-dependent oxidoreductase [Lewinella sp. 4G2]OAV42897.1 hypothetical protein A3850_016875 [Lewinella sp. 4G2]